LAEVLAEVLTATTLEAVTEILLSAVAGPLRVLSSNAVVAQALTLLGSELYQAGKLPALTSFRIEELDAGSSIST
jgi:hypothetical protein